MRILILLSLLMFGCVHTTNYVHTPTIKVRYYDSKGKYIGHSEKGKYQTRYYDKKGKYIGHSKGE